MNNTLIATVGSIVLILAPGIVEADLNDGLIAHYKFDGNALNAVSNSLNGFVIGASLSSDRFGNSDSAYRFDGIDDSIQVNNVSLGSEMTFSTWAYTESGASFRHFAGASNRFALWYADDEYNWITGNGSNWSTPPGGGYVFRHDTTPMNEWFHIAGVYTGTRWQVYVDGELGADEPAAQADIGDFAFTIGDRYKGFATNNHFFHGSLDDVRIYNRALSGSEISALSLEPAAPSQAERLSIGHLPTKTSTGGLILIAHGYNSAPNIWADDLSNKIATKLAGTGRSDDWDIVAWDWEQEADFGEITSPRLPKKAASIAEQIGVSVGRDINTSGYDKVHLVGHSAGSHLIDAATREIDEGVQVTNTFLDAYTPEPFLKGNRYLGDAADWAIQYYTTLDLAYTDTVLNEAYNVDITALDPDVHAYFAIPPSLRGQFDIVDGHQFAHEWYRDTVLAPSDPMSPGWGFPLSLEAGLIPSHDDFPRGDKIKLVDGTALPEIDPPTAPKVIFGVPVSFEDLSNFESDTGVITRSGTQTIYETGSPVWTTSIIELATRRDYLSIEFAFEGGSGGEGLFAVYWDGMILGTFDERYVGTDREEYFFDLGGTGVPGPHSLSFRLDSYNDLTSKVVLDNVRFAAQVVPLPASFTFLIPALGICGFVANVNRSKTH